MTAGRPSEFNVVDLEQLRYLLEEKGFTDQDLANFYRVSRTTITNWKNAHPEFLATIKESKAGADSKVERSLFERAIGYSHPDMHISVHDGKVIKTPIRKHYPPDPTSMIFWLKNRQPGRWREKLEVQDDRFTNLLNHINRKEARDGQGKHETGKGESRKGRGKE